MSTRAFRFLAVLAVLATLVIGAWGCGDDDGGSNNGLCGNHVCDPGEDASSCPSDCLPLEICDNGVDDDLDGQTDCDDTECAAEPGCAVSSCGNDYCELDEDATSCPDDCFCNQDGICDVFNSEDASACTDDCTGGACAEGADLIAQNGCTGDETCDWMGGPNFQCREVGTAGVYESCSMSTDCQIGTYCFDMGDGSRCYPWCLFGGDLYAACPGAGFCNMSIQGLDGAWLCMLPTECDPVDGTGCGAGLHCIFNGAAMSCGGLIANPAAVGEPCAGGYANGCETGAWCHQDTCYEVCHAGSVDECTSGTCSDTFPNIGFGLCM